MADSNGTLYLASGRQLSVFFPANGAVGTYVPIDGNQVAVSTSKTEFRNKIADRVVSIVAGPATGTLQFVSNGDKKPVLIDMANHQNSNSGRPALNIPIAAGEDISFIVAAVLPA